MGHYFNFHRQKDILDCCILSDLIYQKDKYIENLYNLTKIKMSKNDKNRMLSKCDGVQKDFYLTINKLVKIPFLYKLSFSIKNKSVDIHFGIFLFKDKLVLSYQGTYDWNEVIADLDIKQVSIDEEYPDILVHEGFLNAYKTSEYIILDYIKEYINRYPNNNIYITGHSLGAAISTLSTFFLHEKFKNKNIHCVTFGCPKIGNKNFVEYYNKNISNNIQFINNEDIIPTLPPLPNYSLLKPIYVIKKGKIIKDDNSKRITTMVFDFFLSIFNYTKSPISMHHCDNYLNDLKESYLDLFISLNEEDEE